MSPSVFGDYFDRLERFQRRFGTELPPDPVGTRWQISRSGNLTQEYRCVTLSLFPGKSSRFMLCVAGPADWGRRFYDLGAGNLTDALKEAERKAQHTIADDVQLRRLDRQRGGRRNG